MSQTSKKCQKTTGKPLELLWGNNKVMIDENSTVPLLLLQIKQDNSYLEW